MQPQSAVATPQPITTSTEGLTKLQQTQASQQKPVDILTSRETSLGVPQAQQQVSGLRQAITNTTNLLNQVAPSVQGRTAESLVTSAQANKQIQNEQAPIQQNISDLGSQYQLASADYNDLKKSAETQAGLEIQGNQNDLSFYNNLYQNLFGQEQATADRSFKEKQFGEQVRQFDVDQSTRKEQFEKNLELDTKRYNLSVEQQNEIRRQFEATQQTQKDQFAEQQKLAQASLSEQIRSNKANESISASKGGGGSSSDGLGSALAALFAGNQTPPAPVKVDPNQEAAYTSVQKFLSQGMNAAKSDYAATLKSANYGNAMDKIKVQLYNQNGIK